MARHDAAFAGSIPQLYDRYLGPLLFQPYADELARRAAERATDAAAAALKRFEGPDGLDAPMATHIVTAIA